ncbi:Transferring glycosyl group transferase [Thalictrum thalictroides]|uniref:Transferring glycosyl group transferase n=1 Tax=Thalictrum thalictroides TaxID=46969 RepID=A0A7J6VJ34_THATH|nr:Transferring glycosyl group transferase [Thalictrum thalictroides]
MPSPYTHSKTLTTTITTRLIKTPLLLLSSFFLLYLLYRTHISPSLFTPTITSSLSTPTTTTTTSIHHLVFGIASSSRSYPKRLSYIHTWFKPYLTRGYVFLDRIPNDTLTSPFPIPTIISKDTSKFPYTFPRGLRSAIRVSRIVKELVDLNLSDVRWFVFGDDDTVFFTENLVKMLSKYDHNKWYYIGSNSESFDQNTNYSFDMAFGGGGFAISYSLGKVLAKVLDKCLMRYSHLYGSDSRIFSCLAELGVGLTHEPGFHQVDMRGSLFGMLSAHPLAPLISLHHLDNVEPIFPGMNHSQALDQLLLAVKVDSERILQQTVCYDHSKSLTISISWGYSVQVYEGNQLLPDLLPLQRSFVPWRRSVNVYSNPFMFNVREYSKYPCKRPAVFYLENVFSKANEIQSNYKRQFVKNCVQNGSLENLEEIVVFSQKLDLDIGKLQAPRRHCCDVLNLFDTKTKVLIRQCGDEELIAMDP